MCGGFALCCVRVRVCLIYVESVFHLQERVSEISSLESPERRRAFEYETHVIQAWRRHLGVDDGSLVVGQRRIHLVKTTDHTKSEPTIYLLISPARANPSRTYVARLRAPPGSRRYHPSLCATSPHIRTPEAGHCTAPLSSRRRTMAPALDSWLPVTHCTSPCCPSRRMSPPRSGAHPTSFYVCPTAWPRFP